MVAYSIDAAAVLAVLRDTEAELAPLDSLSSDLHGGVDAVCASLGPSPVAGAFTRFAANTFLADVRSGMAVFDRALQSVRAAVSEYAAADAEMRARAEAAAGAVPAASPGLIPALPLPRPGPRPQNPDPLPQPEPERGKVVPLPGPPPWRPIRPRQPLPVLPSPFPVLPNPLPARPVPLPPPGHGFDPPRWLRPPGWVWRPPGWWWRPPGKAKWPHEAPGHGLGPPSGWYYPLVPLKNPLPPIGPPVARMLSVKVPAPNAAGVLPDADENQPVSLAPGHGTTKWGLTGARSSI